jgi:hypothetical protein
MEKQFRVGRKARVELGFAADSFGSGIACARVVEAGRERTLRVPFTLRPMPALLGRDVAYAALTAVADEVRALDTSVAEFVVQDERLGLDLSLRRSLPGALSLPYVRLRCALNRFREATVTCRITPETTHLTDLARCEIGLLAAA